MRLATWNVNSVRAHLAFVLAWVEANEPDVLGLQETNCPPRSFPVREFEALGYEVALFGGEGGRGGVALLSRVGLDDVVLGVPGAVAPLAERRSIAANCGDLRVHTVYAPNGRKVGTDPHRVKLAWFQLLARWLDIDGLGERPIMLIGDLNIAPLDVDVWEPSRYRKRNLTSPLERAAFNDLIELGLVDLVREHFGEDHVFTWWNRRSDFYESDRGWRLDHALADAATASRVDDVWVDRAERGREGNSDHAPVVVDLAD